MFGRDIVQTLVLTPSRSVTDTSDDLFGMFEKRGYQFVSMDEALADEAYKTPENFGAANPVSFSLSVGLWRKTRNCAMNRK